MNMSSILNNGLWWLSWLHWNDLMAIFWCKRSFTSCGQSFWVRKLNFQNPFYKAWRNCTFLVIRESTGIDWTFIKTLYSVHCTYRNEIFFSSLITSQTGFWNEGSFSLMSWYVPWSRVLAHCFMGSSWLDGNSHHRNCVTLFIQT